MLHIWYLLGLIYSLSFSNLSVLSLGRVAPSYVFDSSQPKQPHNFKIYFSLLLQVIFRGGLRFGLWELARDHHTWNYKSVDFPLNLLLLAFKQFILLNLRCLFSENLAENPKRTKNRIFLLGAGCLFECLSVFSKCRHTFDRGR